MVAAHRTYEPDTEVVDLLADSTITTLRAQVAGLNTQLVEYAYTAIGPCSGECAHPQCTVARGAQLGLAFGRADAVIGKLEQQRDERDVAGAGGAL